MFTNCRTSYRKLEYYCYDCLFLPFAVNINDAEGFGVDDDDNVTFDDFGGDDDDIDDVRL